MAAERLSKITRWFKTRPAPLVLYCGTQNYDWGERGDRAFIPELLGFHPKPNRPYAELWIGSHPLKPAQAEGAFSQTPIAPLDRLIRRFPEEILGAAAFQKFGPRLPFLMKVLAISKALSVQAHPGKEQAVEGFEREESLGLSLNDPHRSYKDDQHKPELIVAVTEFFMLNRFSPLAEVKKRLARWKDLRPLFPDIHDANSQSEAPLRSAYQKIMKMDQAHLDPYLTRWIASLEAKGPYGRGEIEYWILRTDRAFSQQRYKDRGLCAFLFLNFLRLSPGQGCYLDAGELHTYLEGVGVEVMSNSDNVLRGGLTSKHIDVAELLRVLSYESGPVKVLVPEKSGVYATPAEEFELSVVRLDAKRKRFAQNLKSVEILLVLEGEVSLKYGKFKAALKRGSIVALPACLKSYELAAGAGECKIYRCSVPVKP